MSYDLTAAEWMTSLVLGAAAAMPQLTLPLVYMDTFHGSSGSFEIFGIPSTTDPVPLVQTGTYKLYVTSTPSGKDGLMKVSATPDAVDNLFTEMLLLRSLQAEADRLDDEARERGERPYYYGAQFPRVLESVRLNDTRCVFFLGYHPDIESYRQLIPLSLLTQHERVDLKSIQWILGKLLRLLAFVHSQGSAIGLTDASNVLLETDLHGVFVLDFSRARSLAKHTTQTPKWLPSTSWQTRSGPRR
jgi:hypothetical protein